MTRYEDLKRNSNQRSHHLSERDDDRGFSRSRRDFESDWGDRGEGSPRRRQGHELGSRRYMSPDRYNEDFDFQDSSRADYTGYKAEERGHFGKGPQGWKRSDERIKDEVCEALYRSYDVDASGISVTVKEGCVSLKGSVDTRDAKRAAERCVENLSGVEDVQNELKVTRQTDIRNNSHQTNLS